MKSQGNIGRIAAAFMSHRSLIFIPLLFSSAFGDLRSDLEPFLESHCYDCHDDIDAEDGSNWRAWCADWRNAVPPGGESLNAFVARISAWLEDQAPNPHDAVVTHAGVIRVCRVLSGASWEEAMSSENPFLGWTKHSIKHPDSWE